MNINPTDRIAKIGDKLVPYNVSQTEENYQQTGHYSEDNYRYVGKGFICSINNVVQPYRFYRTIGDANDA
jgi:hypothetical protein